RMALNCDERCRCQPKGVSPRIPQPGLRKCCWLRLWIVLRLWMSGFQLLGTLRNKLLCTLGRLRQQLRHSLRACEIRLRRTVRTDFLLRVPAAPRGGEIGRSTRKPRPSPWGRRGGKLQVSARGMTVEEDPPHSIATRLRTASLEDHNCGNIFDGEKEPRCAKR